eukprot:2692245-Pyramimonas_sp.AAC.1
MLGQAVLRRQLSRAIAFAHSDMSLTACVLCADSRTASIIGCGAVELVSVWKPEGRRLAWR